jgi:hypothetical protein
MLPPEVRILGVQRVRSIGDFRGKKILMPTALGETVPDRWGSKIYLPAARYEKVNDETIRFAVAHQIAHAIFHNYFFDDVSKDNWSDMERFADAAAARWGISPSQEFIDTGGTVCRGTDL